MQLLTVPINSIDEGERWRKDYGDVAELSENIKKHGLIQPLAVKMQEGDKPYLLIAGGRRLRALQLAGKEDVPVRLFEGEVSEMEKITLELAENFYRKDLDFREYTAITAKLHNMKQEMEGVKVGRIENAPGWGVDDTAKLLGVDRTTVSKDLQIAGMLEANPELFEGCKNKSDAAKVIKKVQEQAIVEELARRAQRSSSEGSKQMLMNSYILMDFFEGVKNIPNDSMDLVEIDPPYGINLKEYKQNYDINYTNDYNEIDKEDYPPFIRRLFKECYRVMSENSWLICWYAPEPWAETVFTAAKSAGFSGMRLPGIWVKTQAQSNNPNIYLSNGTEYFYYFRKGSPVLAKSGRINTFHFTPVPPNNKTHPTERPIELMQEILSTFGQPTIRMLVPFAGSGVTLLAAHSLGMKPIGYDLAKMYRDSYLVRVHNL